MKRIVTVALYLLGAVMLAAVSCSYVLYQYFNPITLVLASVLMFVFINSSPLLMYKSYHTVNLCICHHGLVILKLFVISAALSVIYHIVYIFCAKNAVSWIISAIIAIVTQAIVFWNGIVSVYLTSVQLGIKKRIIGAIFGMVPIVNIILLAGIIKTVSKEIQFETEKHALNQARKQQQVCATKYPILLVHGVFFRDSRYFNYWGRIPKELQINGAKIFYGNQQSAASIKDCATELAAHIMEITKSQNVEKVNVIAHSKGGLDMRYALAHCGISDKIASLTTVNTPHRGCQFADFLLGVVPETLRDKIANTYNKALKRFGDPNPDFLAAVNDLTYSKCKITDTELVAPSNVFCQSIGTRLNRAASGKFPLNFTYHLVKYFDGGNDGLVAESSFSWGENYTLLTVNGPRGISHGDIIDLNRENIDGFDVREFYVKLVSKLKEQGY